MNSLISIVRRHFGRIVLIAIINFLLIRLFDIISDQGSAVAIVVNAFFLTRSGPSRLSPLLLHGCQAVILLYGVYLRWFGGSIDLSGAALYVILIASTFLISVNAIIVGLIEEGSQNCSESIGSNSNL